MHLDAMFILNARVWPDKFHFYLLTLGKKCTGRCGRESLRVSYVSRMFIRSSRLLARNVNVDICPKAGFCLSHKLKPHPFYYVCSR